MKAHLLPPSTRHHCNEFNQRFHSFHIHTCLLANSGVKKQVYGVPSWRSQQRKASSIVGYSFAEMMKNKKTHTQIPFIQFPLLSCNIKLFTTNSALILPARRVFLILRWHRTSVVVCRWLLGHFSCPLREMTLFLVSFIIKLVWFGGGEENRNETKQNHVTYSTVAVPSELRCYGIRVADSRGAR